MSSQETRQIKQLIGANIRLARKLAGKTQLQLASTLEVDPIQVSRWERGLHRPSDGRVVALAQVLGQEPVWFYVDHSGEPAHA